MTYELVYEFGGHGGPYPSLESAIERAEAQLRNGLPADRRIYVVPRDMRILDRRNAVHVVTREPERD